MPRGRLDTIWAEIALLTPEVGWLMKFRYTNWRGDEHEYVVEPEAFAFGRYDNGGTSQAMSSEFVLHAYVVTRDGDPRPEMGNTRRRTFMLNGLEDVEIIPRST